MTPEQRARAMSMGFNSNFIFDIEDEGIIHVENVDFAYRLQHLHDNWCSRSEDYQREFLELIGR